MSTETTPGRIAVITGASSGIGEETARVLTAAGYRVALLARRVDRIRTLADELGAGAIAIEADVTDRDSIVAASRRVQDAFGGVDVLINNAGVFEAIAVDASRDDWSAAWSRTMQINLQASADLSRRAILHWRDRGAPGRLVNITSRAAYRGDSPAHWHYAASKAGMVAMTKSIARGYAGEGILTFAVCPGFVMTGMAEDYLASRGGDKLLADIPLGRVADPSEVASVATYLALDAPGSMTGAVLDVNGASFVR